MRTQFFGPTGERRLQTSDAVPPLFRLEVRGRRYHHDDQDQRPAARTHSRAPVYHRLGADRFTERREVPVPHGWDPRRVLRHTYWQGVVLRNRLPGVGISQASRQAVLEVALCPTGHESRPDAANESKPEAARDEVGRPGPRPQRRYTPTETHGKAPPGVDGAGCGADGVGRTYNNRSSGRNTIVLLAQECPVNELSHPYLVGGAHQFLSGASAFLCADGVDSSWGLGAGGRERQIGVLGKRFRIGV